MTMDMLLFVMTERGGHCRQAESRSRFSQYRGHCRYAAMSRSSLAGILILTFPVLDERTERQYLYYALTWQA